MNSIVETINAAGRGFTALTLPLLIQSSLLILLLLAADAILRKKVRAVFRYWIWMLVLVKLILPPSLGSPVSIGTWLGDRMDLAAIAPFESQEPQPAESSPVVTNILSQPEPMFVEPPVPQPMTIPSVQQPAKAEAPAVTQAAPLAQPPATPLTWQGLVLLVWAGIVIALMLLLVQRAFFVQGLAAQADEASDAMLDEMEHCRRQIGLRGQIALRLSPNATSPAVCGLLHPVILIPQNLTSRLQGSDLQAVLLHELAHVKRGDLWISLVQTLLQIIYFYHPLLWLANAVMRRVREQAVDETVLVAMGETAQQYPETLVNVAKLAFRRRPALSLRLIGVVESKNALSARISHILNRPLPKTARLGAAGLAAIVIAAAVLLPMAKGQSRVSTVTVSQEPPAGASQGRSANTNPVRPETAEKRRVYLPDLETPGANTVLDLGTGELLAGEPMSRDPMHFDKLGKGDVAYEYVGGKSGLLCFRGARILTVSTPQFGDPQTREISQPDVQRPGFVAYFIDAPRRYLIETADGRRYELNVISIDKGDSGGALVEWGMTSSTPDSSTAPQSDQPSGRVVDPNGRPVAGAQVGLSAEKIGVVIKGGRLEQPRTSDMEKGQIVETDAQGRFRFESKLPETFDVIAAHNEAGFALVASDEFLKNREVRLERWGRIEGQVAEGRQPLEDQICMSGLPNPTWLKHKREFSYQTRCDDKGRFVFTRVPAGWFEVGYLTKTDDMASSPTSRTPVVVKAGETTTMKLGGEGRPVIGRFVPPAGYTGPVYFGAGLRALWTWRPDPPRPANYDQMTKREQQEWSSRQWWQSPQYKAYSDSIWHNPNWRGYVFRINADGSFRIEDVIPGKYDMTVYLEESRLRGGHPEDLGSYSAVVEVPPMAEAYTDKPLDLGNLTLGMRNPLRAGDEAPLFEAKTLGGQDIRLIDYRGRFVLLAFWQPAFHPELDRLKELHQTYGSTGKLQVIGLGGGDTLKEVQSYIDEHRIEWPEIYIGEKWEGDAAKGYRLAGNPYILLIDPEGKVVATWLRGEKLTSTVHEALQSVPTPAPATSRAISGRVVDPSGASVAGAGTTASMDGKGAGGGALVELARPDATQDGSRLKQLLAAARPWSTVVVPAGRYTAPVEITQPLTLRGESTESCIIEVTADQPALLINTQGRGQVAIQNLTIRWQLAGDKKVETPAALLAKDTNALIQSCRFAPLGDFQRSPTAVYIEGRSASKVADCRFNGFNYVICCGPDTEGWVLDSIITDCGHQGVIGYDRSTLVVQGNIIAGSKFHGVRSTGGQLNVIHNLLIGNANRGIYLGNKTGSGMIVNNLIMGNGTGISAFGQAVYTIASNVILDNRYAGIDMRDSCQLSIHSNVLVKNQRGIKLFKEGSVNHNRAQDNTFWANAMDVEDLERPIGSVTADPQFADPNHGDFAMRGPSRGSLTDPQVIKDLWKRYEQLRREPSTRVEAVSQSPQAQAASPASAVLAWQRTDRYVPPDPDGFFPDDPEGGKKLDALYQAVDKDRRLDEEILSTVRQGFQRTTQHRTLILSWLGTRYIWGKDPQNPQAIEIMYHAAPLERYYAVNFGLAAVRNKTPNILRTLADICMQGELVGEIATGIGTQQEELLSYITPHLQDSDPGKREIAGLLLKHFRGELDFVRGQREKRQEQAKAQLGDRLPQLRQVLLTGDSGARYQALTMLKRDGGPALDDSFLPALQATATDRSAEVRNEVACMVGNQWIWHAKEQDPNAIAIEFKLAGDADREVRNNAVYYGLSVVRNANEPVVRRLVEMALADHEFDPYDRIVWGLTGPMQAAPELLTKVLAGHLDRAKSDLHYAASVHQLHRDLLGTEPPADWGLARVRERYPDDLFVIPFSAREPFQPVDANALWSEVSRALPQGVTPERLPNWYDRRATICRAEIRGKEQAEAVRNAVENHPRLRVGEIEALTVPMQLFLEERYGPAKSQTQDALPQPTADSGKSTQSPPGPIQQRINAAAPGGTVRLEPGIYRERLRIDKPLTLEGAGWDKTVLSVESRTPESRQQYADPLGESILAIVGARGVTIRGIKFTAPGRRIGNQSLPMAIVSLSHCEARLSACAVVGGAGDGIHLIDQANAVLQRCLVAAVWGTGIRVGSDKDVSEARIEDSDVRNCHYAGIRVARGNKATIERCRVSGAAWHGIRYDDASPLISGNLIFGNARSAIYASGRTAATIKGNLFYANEMGGMSCWFQNGDLIEGNTFANNKGPGLAILGASKPSARSNIFYANSVGVDIADIRADSPFAKSDGSAALENNVFWANQREMQRTSDTSVVQAVALDEKTGVAIDPRFTAPEAKDFSLRADSPARQQGIGAADLIPFESPWPLQPEELAIIPQGDTRDYRQWRDPPLP